MQVLNLCIGRPYKAKDNMGNVIDKKAWTRIGTMFINHDEKTGQPRYSMLFDAYPAHGESIAAFPKEDRNNQGQGQYQPRQNTKTMTQELNDQREEAAAMPTDKELNSDDEEEVRIEDVPF